MNSSIVRCSTHLETSIRNLAESCYNYCIYCIWNILCMCVYVPIYYLIIKFGRGTRLHYDQQNDHNDEFNALMCESATFNSCLIPLDFYFSICMWCYLTSPLFLPWKQIILYDLLFHAVRFEIKMGGVGLFFNIRVPIQFTFYICLV